jgi:hypothetical protein
MSRLSVEEVKVGLVVHLDTAALRKLGGSKTNAQITESEDRAVEGPHYFLVTKLDREDGTCLAVPLFSGSAPGSEKLDEDKKSGHPDNWLGSDSYFSHWQHWVIPLSDIPEASANEESSPDSRRSYAADPEDFEAINKWVGKNICDFRAV